VAVSLEGRDQLEPAREMYELNIAIAESSGSKENLGVMLSLLNLAVHFEAEENLPKAIELAERANAISRKMYEGNHPYWSAYPIMALGALHRDAGALGKARPLLERGLALAGPKARPEAVQALSRLHEVAGEPEKARELYETELAGLEEQHGLEHPLLAFILHDMSHHHRDYGNVSDAMRALQRAVKILPVETRELHEQPVHFVIDLAECYVDLGRHDEAEPLLLETLAILKRALGEGHSHSLKVQWKLASLAAAQGERDKALEFLREAVDQGWTEDQVFDETAFEPLRGDPEFEAIVAEVRERSGEE
jgi:tetratricopeptide (TPR) repeat protein